MPLGVEARSRSSRPAAAGCPCAMSRPSMRRHRCPVTPARGTRRMRYRRWCLWRGTLLDDDETLDAYRSFLVSGTILRAAFERLLERVRPDRIFILNGAFFPERILAEMATARSIPVVRYEK